MLVAIIALAIAGTIALIGLLSIANNQKAMKLQRLVNDLNNCKSQLIMIETALDVFQAQGNQAKVDEYERKKSDTEAECERLLGELTRLRGS